MSLDVITFGCRLNITESEVIRREAAAAGIADAVIVNTCAVTGEAVKQARQSIRKARRERPGAKIIVTGCAAQTDPAEFASMPEVDRVLGNEEKLSAASWISLDSADRISVGDIMASTAAALQRTGGIAGHTRAFLQVQNGCDHRCTFCIIPFGRGNSRSVPVGDVIGQARRLVESGHSEIVLTGVDITSYAAGLGLLVKQVLREVPELKRLRLSSIDSVEADADLLNAFANDDRLMPHLHLSLQAGDDIILKRMKRRHSRAQAVAFCAAVRRLRPDVAFGGDIIAGFPTETEEMFSRSPDLVDECGLTQLHVFPFSPRPGTPAARMPQVAHESIKDRARRLRAKGDAALRHHLEGEVGARRAVLTERGGLARTPQFTPVRLAVPAEPGLIMNIEVAGHDGRQLLAA
ncbi:MAG: tRNA (N(6)-L-threonylcarbamoyladenosine(37)-C(2))-methylthiotransferase MtaB [Alphaproteobacteria bacterium]|nr:tRNA (N(6)-L-threonylcarbamoyladenosine(37)-C(2))-methylthiotransferase MtaB [Alphaproteobacteria bacterium]